MKPLFAPLEIQNAFFSIFDESQPARKPLIGERNNPKIEFKMVEPFKGLYSWQGQAKIRLDEAGPAQLVNLDIN